ncbi:unnamed protein product [Adineta ricciae]|uniref:Uncharacterized protein n=1 Tax=Adineta ricciae TaxID=249248 RepID=A0A813TM00_ADIRI|nr:unnamed protein product [Adineta ricciae]
MLFPISTLVIADVRQTDRFGCHVRSRTRYGQIYVNNEILLLAVIAPRLMTLFDLITVYNTKQLHITPVAISRFRRTQEFDGSDEILVTESHWIPTVSDPKHEFPKGHHRI